MWENFSLFKISRLSLVKLNSEDILLCAPWSFFKSLDNYIRKENIQFKTQSSNNIKMFQFFLKIFSVCLFQTYGSLST